MGDFLYGKGKYLVILRFFIHNICSTIRNEYKNMVNHKNIKISEDARIAKQSVIVGDVTIGRDS